MDEMQNSAAPQEQTAPAAEAPSPALEDEWDDIDLSDLEVLDQEGNNGSEDPAGEPEVEPDADQQDGEAKGEEAPADQQETKDEKPEGEDQPLVELKHLGQVVRVTPEERDALAQMGMDYQRIREDRDAARAEVTRLKELEGFLQELAAPSGLSIEDLMDSTRAQMLADREGIDEAVALQRVKLDRDRKAFEAQQASANQQEKEKQQADAKRQDAFLRFAREYPEVNPTEIPVEVWRRFEGGEDLVSAYARHEAKTLREENAALRSRAETAEKNAENKVRATGSQKSAGTSGDMDEFDRAWYDGT